MHVRHNDLQVTLPYKALWFPWSTENIRWSQKEKREPDFGSGRWAGHKVLEWAFLVQQSIILAPSPDSAALYRVGHRGLGRNQSQMNGIQQTAIRLIEPSI